MGDRIATRPAAGGAAWLAVAVVATALIVGAAVVVLSTDRGPRPPFLQDGDAAPSGTSPQPPREHHLTLAGSGSNLPITRALAAAFAGPDARPLVHPSIGSSGGMRALLDGAIDVALISRPLKEREQALGLVAIPYARVPVMVVVHGEVPDREITTSTLVAVFAGHRATWSDNSRITVLQRERGDSSHAAIDRIIPGFAETNEQAYREERWRVLYHDDAMTDAVDATPGAIGLFGQGAIPAGRSIRALRIDGVDPDVETLERGSYPFYKDLAFVTAGEPTGAAADFIEFVRSPRASAIIREAGGLPLASAPREAP